MGFYSDVRIISRKKLAEDIKGVFNKYNFEADRIIENDTETIFDLFSLKWYPDFDIVRDINDLLYDADEEDEEDYGYMYLIGNEDGSNETSMHPDSTFYDGYYNQNNVFFNLALYRKIVSLQKFLYRGHDFTDEEYRRIMWNFREEEPFVLYFKSNGWTEEKYSLSIEEEGFKPEEDPLEDYNVCVEIRPQGESSDWAIKAVIIEEVAKTLAALLEEYL